MTPVDLRLSLSTLDIYLRLLDTLYSRLSGSFFNQMLEILDD